MQNYSIAVSGFRNNYTLFYTNNYYEEIINEDQRKIIETFLQDDSFQ